MSDGDCKTALDWYRACAQLSCDMYGTDREGYTAALIENVKLSWDDVRNSQRTLSTLSLVQREVGSIVETILYPPQLLAVTVSTC